MNKYLLISVICLLSTGSGTYGQANYLDYHKEVVKCEQFIAEHKFREAITHFDSLFNSFDFVFLRDIKLATQLSAFEKNHEYGFRFLKKGILNGWTLRDIEKNEKLDFFKDNAQWESLKSEYDSLHNLYLAGLNSSLREEVHKMFKKDQKKALGALFRIGPKSKEKYAVKKFVPHSEKQLNLLNEILDQHGYPGEQFIGNSLWTSVILSHHNSISEDYNSKDTLYAQIKPKLINALKNGEISLYEFATIEDWRTAVLNDHKSTSYGFLGAIPNDSVLAIVNKNRAEIGLRNTELRNDLIDIEIETGMNLYLPKGWQKGKIMVADKP